MNPDRQTTRMGVSKVTIYPPGTGLKPVHTRKFTADMNLGGAVDTVMFVYI